jgi:hypothetical protein
MKAYALPVSKQVSKMINCVPGGPARLTWDLPGRWAIGAELRAVF